MKHVYYGQVNLKRYVPKFKELRKLKSWHFNMDEVDEMAKDILKSPQNYVEEDVMRCGVYKEIKTEDHYPIEEDKVKVFGKVVDVHNRYYDVDNDCMIVETSYELQEDLDTREDNLVKSMNRAMDYMKTRAKITLRINKEEREKRDSIKNEVKKRINEEDVESEPKESWHKTFVNLFKK